MPSLQRALVLAIFPLLTRSLCAQDNPEEILKPSVVSIRNDECWGSGMFLDDKGLILTNAHVACSPLPFRVHALGKVQGSFKELVFRKVALIGFHQEYDLALLRIDPAEQDAKVTPVAVAPGPPAVNERVWAMGFPGDVNHGQTKVLSWGEVRSADREFYGDRYYELDIAVYHGNSGGPVTNSKGQVLGVVTFGLKSSVLAIPISEVKPARFGPLRSRAPNRTLSSQYLDEAEKLLQGPADLSSIARAVSMYEEALIWDASNGSLYLKVGQINLLARRFPIAAAYLVRSVQLQPWPEKPDVYLDLGLAFAGLKKEDEARATWTEGVRKFPLENSLIWGAAGQACEKQRSYYEAACFARIAIRTFSDRPADINALYQRVESKLTADETSKLRDLESHLDDHLARLRSDADRAHSDGKAFMTKEAEKAIAGFEGVQQEGNAAEIGKVAFGAETKKPVYSDSELNARFVRGRVEVAKEHVRSGRTEKAVEILEDVLKTYPLEPESEAARLLLKLLGKR